MSKEYVSVTQMFPRLYICIALEKKNCLEENISLDEINLPRPEVIIAFNLLRNRHISLLCV